MASKIVSAFYETFDKGDTEGRFILGLKLSVVLDEVQNLCFQALKIEKDKWKEKNVLKTNANVKNCFLLLCCIH